MQRLLTEFQEHWPLIRRYLQSQRSLLLLTAGLLFASIGLRLIGPRLVRSFIQGLSDGASQEQLVWLAAAFIAASLAGQAFKILAEYGSERIAWAASNRLRLDLAAHLLGLDAAFHQQRTPGELIERADGDVSSLSSLFSSLLVKLAGSLLLLVGVLTALFLESWQLGLAFATFAALTVLVLNRVRRLAGPFLQESRERSALHYGYLGEAISAAEDLRSAGAVGYAVSRFAAHLRGWLPAALRAEVLGALVWVSALGAFALADGAAFGLSGWLYLRGTISLGTVYMVIAYAALLAQPIEMLRSQMQSLQQAGASLSRVRELLATRSRLKDGSEPLPAGPLAVEFEHVTFRYAADEPVLDRLSIRLAPGERLGLMGRTGSGKSTIARLLIRLYDPAEGSVRLGGIDLRALRLADLRSRVGLVTQEVQLFEASLRENLTFFDPTVPDETLREVLHRLGLQEWLERQPQGLETPISPSALSAGEAQLLAFARVFLRDPGLVILDEASSRLDPATEALLDQAMHHLLEGRTAIIIAHRTATLQQVDQVMVMEKGVLSHAG